MKSRQRNADAFRCNLVLVETQGFEIMRTSVTLDDDLLPMLMAEKARLARAAGLREISNARTINAVLRRALTTGKGKAA